MCFVFHLRFLAKTLLNKTVALFGQASVVAVGMSKKKEINQKPKKTSSIKFIVVHTRLRFVLMGQMFAPFGQWMKSTRLDSNRLVSFRLSICTICECSFIFRLFVDVTFNGAWATTDSSNICNCFSMEMTLKLVSTCPNDEEEEEAHPK